jgi:hypothetical protein
MITLADKPNYATVTFLQDAIAGALAGKIALVNFHAAGDTSLPHELRTGQSLPRNLALDFSPLLDILHLPQLPQLGTGGPNGILGKLCTSVSVLV